MKTVIVALTVLALSVAADAADDPGAMDTLRIGSISTYPDRQVVLPVSFFNDEILSAVEVVLMYDTTYITMDTFSYKEGRLGYIEEGSIVFRDSANLIQLVFIDMTAGFISEGNGLLCNLHFTVFDTAEADTAIIDAGAWPFFPFNDKITMFVGDTIYPIYPYIVPGYIAILEVPENPDSVWVDKVTGMPGQSVEVNIYGYNSKPVDSMNLALQYPSGSLTYNSVVFTDTRGESALIQNTIPFEAGTERQLLITLGYDEASPLAPGSGPLATIIFDIDASAQDDTVVIDSVTFLNAQSLEFCLTEEYGGLIFTPWFTPGYVAIQSSTPVEETDQAMLPADYYLAQNYPNPFNPITVISFDLPGEEHVILEVYNVLGQKVKTLVNGRMPAGRYRINFDGRGDNNDALASGIYFYRIRAGEFSQSRKMTLMK